MRPSLFLFPAALIMAVPGPAHAAGEAEAYRRLALSRGIETEVRFPPPGEVLDLNPAPVAKPEAEPERVEISPETSRLFFMLVAGIFLAFLGVLVFRHGRGGFFTVRAAPPDAEARGAEGPAPGLDRDQPESPADRFLAEIARMADRRAALHLLLGRALLRAAEANGLKPGRSWTARDLLRALPSGWPYRADLAEVLRAAERAWFGGREPDGAEVERRLALARPIVAGGGRP